VQCPQCGVEGRATRTKPRKTDGKTFAIFECSGVCKNDRGYPFSWFPPKTGAAPAGQQQAAAPQASIGVLQDIAHEMSELKAVNLAMNMKLTKVVSLLEKLAGVKPAAAPVEVDGPAVASDELAPDEEIPF